MSRRSRRLLALLPVLLFFGGHAPALSDEPLVTKLSITVQTGRDDKGADSAVYFSCSGCGGRLTLSAKGETLRPYTRKYAVWTLPRPIRPSSIGSMRVEIDPGSGDQWRFEGLRVLAGTALENVEVYDDMELREELSSYKRAWLSGPPVRSGKAEAEIITGADDLRGFTCHSWINLVFEDNAVRRYGFASSWGSGTTLGTYIPSYSGRLQRVEIVMDEHFRGGLLDQVDNWDIARLRVTAPSGPGRVDLFHSTNVGRLTCGNAWQSPQLRPRQPLADWVQQIQFWILTGNDDLRSDSRAVVGVELGDGTRVATEPFADAKDRSLKHVGPTSASVRLPAIKKVWIQLVSGNDDWAIKGIVVEGTVGTGVGGVRVYENYRLDARVSRGHGWTSPDLASYRP